MYKIMYSIQDINNRTAIGKGAMPIKDSTSDGTSTFSLYRSQYANTYEANSLPHVSSKKWLSGSRDTSQIIFNKRVNNMGVSLNPTGELYTMTRSNPNDAVVAKARVRSSGSVVPRKKLFWEIERAKGNL